MHIVLAILDGGAGEEGDPRRRGAARGQEDPGALNNGAVPQLCCFSLEWEEFVMPVLRLRQPLLALAAAFRRAAAAR